MSSLSLRKVKLGLSFDDVAGLVRLRALLPSLTGIGFLDSCGAMTVVAAETTSLYLGSWELTMKRVC